ncbi:hypothetical protein ACH492_23725 [Streptomyces sp. NPDC019443]|uniref:hypothetical protein n=1 Tax=Streptomyces sp. NPDC019443 TaxID=3365061 RepID=UPI00379D0886
MSADRMSGVAAAGSVRPEPPDSDAGRIAGAVGRAWASADGSPAGVSGCRGALGPGGGSTGSGETSFVMLDARSVLGAVSGGTSSSVMRDVLGVGSPSSG